MSKVKVAKAVQNVVLGLAVLILLTILWFVGLGLVSWYVADSVSFMWVMGIIGGIVVILGSIAAMDWAEKVLKEAEEEEKQAQKRSERERRDRSGGVTKKSENGRPRPTRWDSEFNWSHLDPEEGM